MEIKNKVFLVYGAGLSGISAYKFIEKHGGMAYLFNDTKIDVSSLTSSFGEYDKLISENNIQTKETDKNFLNENADLNANSEYQNNFNIITKFSDVLNVGLDYAIISPGVQIIGNKNIKKLSTLNISIMSELELGYKFTKGKFIAITGTNGKTTCTYLLNHILSKKFNTFMCGNVGIPITSICDKTNEESVVVCEVSSFMLEIISENFKPDISVITNIAPDHISRHKTFENYATSKQKITAYQTESSYLIIPESLNNIESKAQVLKVNGTGKYKSKLIGEFNKENIAICEQVCLILGVKNKDFKKYLKVFMPVPFRLELLGKKKGITYINDSKSTNPDSCISALKALKKPVIIMLGGSDKGNDYYDIFKEQKYIKLALLYGETADKLEKDALFMGFTKISKFKNLKDTLYYIKTFIAKGDIVLLSPACASYDEFNNYIERGECFNNFFKELT